MTFNPELEEPVKIVQDNQQSPRLQSRADDIPDNSKEIKITLLTIDSAILNYMSERIQPIVSQQGVQVKVPVIYGSPERWKSAQKDGILRDSIGKIQLPIIMVRRTSMKKTSINSAVNKYYDREFYTGWNRRTPYDHFSVVNGITPSREYYNTTAMPDYYEITYRVMAWTEYMEQMNSVIENISFESDEFWGEQNQYKFRTRIKSFETLSELPNNADRVVRTQFDMTVYAYLLPESQLDVGHNRGMVTKKRYGTKKVVVFSEVEGGGRAIVTPTILPSLTRTSLGKLAAYSSTPTSELEVAFDTADWATSTDVTISLSNNRLRTDSTIFAGVIRNTALSARSSWFVQEVVRISGSAGYGGGMGPCTRVQDAAAPDDYIRLIASAGSLTSPNKLQEVVNGVETTTSPNTIVVRSLNTDYRFSLSTEGTVAESYDFGTATSKSIASGTTTGRAGSYHGLDFAGPAPERSAYYAMTSRYVTVNGLPTGATVQVRDSLGNTLSSAVETSGTATVDMLTVVLPTATEIRVLDSGLNVLVTETPTERVWGGDIWLYS